MGLLTNDIQVDETMWSHYDSNYQKLNEDKLSIFERQIWVFGMIEEQDINKAKIFVVTHRKTETLYAHIADNCDEGAHIHSDGWKPYR